MVCDVYKNICVTYLILPEYVFFPYRKKFSNDREKGFFSAGNILYYKLTRKIFLRLENLERNFWFAWKYIKIEFPLQTFTFEDRAHWNEDLDGENRKI